MDTKFPAYCTVFSPEICRQLRLALYLTKCCQNPASLLAQISILVTLVPELKQCADAT